MQKADINFSLTPTPLILLRVILGSAGLKTIPRPPAFELMSLKNGPIDGLSLLSGLTVVNLYELFYGAPDTSNKKIPQIQS